MNEPLSLALVETTTGMGIILALTVLALLGIVWNWQRDTDNSVDIKDLICHQGHLHQGKFMRFGAWIVSTWGFIYLIMDHKFSEWYFAGYMAAWAGNALISKYLDRGIPATAANSESEPESEPEPNPPTSRRPRVR
jgi:hypothetical protein